MQRHLAFVCVLAGVPVGCKIHRLPELPPERDPTAERAPVVPYRPPPDVLTTELSTGEPAGGSGHEGHQGHEGHTMPAQPDESPYPPGHGEHGATPTTKPAEDDKASKPATTDHSGHDHGVGK